MAIVDSQGRLFGKVSILDVGAALVILLVIIGVLLPSTMGIAQVGSSTKPLEVDVIVRSVASSDLLRSGDTTKIIIRNQPFGEVKIAKVEELPRNVPVPQPDGSVKALPDPRPEAGLTRDYWVTLVGNAQITKDGPVLGNNKIKSGTKIELEGLTYNFPDLNVLNVRVKE
ncbi:DUF4330 domain-containing protein [Leptothermofonsia sp. ETS-13]|uniref:DUF4330 domain-containing protein n=1 Tax=Leptothermofonsia sp. ETS-13 TaxID=3035696 RepID=UPI003B9F1F11